MEFRQETFEFVRQNAISQFNKTFTLEEEVLEAQTTDKICANLKQVRETYRPRRQYRLKHAPPKEIVERVQVTLLEYGDKGSRIKSTDSKKLAESVVNSSLDVEADQV